MVLFLFYARAGVFAGTTWRPAKRMTSAAEMLVEFIEIGGWIGRRMLMYISRFPYGNDPDTRGEDP
jgi:hypothetical protein